AVKGSGADGTCGFIAAGTDPKNQCPQPDGGAACGPDGTCDGSHAECRQYAVLNTSCGPSACVGGQVVGQICDGQGTCIASQTPMSCGSYLCDAALGACSTTCATDMDCDASAFCTTTNACVPKGTTGVSCGGAHECLSGFCADGF